MKRLLEITVCRISILLLISLLAACGGEDITDFIEPSDIRLSQLQVVSGGTLMLDENEVEEFDPNILGPYSVRLEESDSDSVDLMIDVDEPSSGASIQLVEVQKGGSGRSRITALSSGETFTVPLDPGLNQILIRLNSNESAARVDYSISINRISSSATLQDIEINGVLGSENRNSDASFSTTFDPEVFSYDVVIDKNDCGVVVQAQPESRFATVEINGEEIKWLDDVFIPLQARTDESDESVTEAVTVVVTAEDDDEGAGSLTYVFNLIKEVETQAELDEDGSISSVSIANSRALSEFRCSNSTTQYRVNSADVDELSITVDLFDHQLGTGGATLRIGERDSDFSNIVIDETTVDTDITPGVAYTGSLLTGIGGEGSEEGRELVVEVTPANSDSDDVVLYSFVLILSETNEVYVDTSETLQDALLNAQPNDEIIVAAGDYEGLLASSGNANAHFFSSQSGTVESPIIVRAEDEDVSLFGDDTALHSVLLLQGDYWEIENIDFSNAQNGLVLDGANNVSVNRFEITDVGERAISIQAGSSNIFLDQGLINRTGLEPEDRTGDGIDEVYGEGIVVGDGSAPSENIAISRVNFGRDIANESIDVKAGASSVQAFSNYFSFDNTLTNAVSDRSIVLLGGGDTHLAFNEFELTLIGAGSDDVSQVVKSEVANSETEIELEQNQLNLAEQSIPLLNNSGSSVVTFIDNTRLDGGVISSIGAVTNAEIPQYQIQSSLDSGQCLTAVGDGPDNRPTVELQTCDSVSEQYWAFEHTDNGFVRIIQRDTTIFSSTSPVMGLPAIPSSQVYYPFYIDDDENEFRTGYLLQWMIIRNGNNVVFANRASDNSFLGQVIPDEDPDTELDDDIVGSRDSDDVEFNFTLIRQ